MIFKILSSMSLQFLNVLASIAICLISFFVLPTYYPNYQAASIIVVMLLFLIIFPCFIMALTAALAYVQVAVFNFSQTKHLKVSTLVISLLSLFAPSLLTGFVGWYIKAWYWEWYIYLIIPFMMLLWTSLIIRIAIWIGPVGAENHENSPKAKF